MEQNLINPRYFNKILFNKNENKIIKLSKNEEKLIDEIEWYLQLPDSLKHYAPYIYSYSREHSKTFLTMEYIHSVTLSTAFVSNIYKKDEWGLIFTKIHDVMNDFSNNKEVLPLSSLQKMYIQKTKNRLLDFINNCKFAKTVNKAGYVSINGKLLECPLKLFEKNAEDILKILMVDEAQIIHGDLCFSNIFYNSDEEKIKLIDPRGSFGKVGLFGDSRYDLAKFRHSIDGYDYIIHDLFDLSVYEKKINFSMPFCNPLQQWMKKFWDEIIGESLNQVRLIEALLFLSMLPLHSDNKKRQLVFYSIGSLMLNSVLEDQNEGS
ncbi:hypothetical protein ACTHO0_19015 [Cytobacillus praedii]|uniref:hypothetical protein n=1 Tax=Cytobacillus praedii TaxID=1742358 RepID=UPI003F8210F7